MDKTQHHLAIKFQIKTKRRFAKYYFTNFIANIILITEFLWTDDSFQSNQTLCGEKDFLEPTFCIPESGKQSYFAREST